jgi:hypothetical protein
MKKSIHKLKSPINQKQLENLLRLPPNVIRHLKDKNILKWKKAGRQHFFEEESVIQFQKTFDRDDYLTVGECKEKLDRWEFYSDKLYNGFYHNKLEIYITVTKLINGTKKIPTKYRLKTIQFGVTQYIPIDSFAKTLNWLRNIYNRKNRKQKIFSPTNKNQSKTTRRRRRSRGKQMRIDIKPIQSGA